MTNFFLIYVEAIKEKIFWIKLIYVTIFYTNFNKERMQQKFIGAFSCNEVSKKALKQK